MRADVYIDAFPDFTVTDVASGVLTSVMIGFGVDIWSKAGIIVVPPLVIALMCTVLVSLSVDVLFMSDVPADVLVPCSVDLLFISDVPTGIIARLLTDLLLDVICGFGVMWFDVNVNILAVVSCVMPVLVDALSCWAGCCCFSKDFFDCTGVLQVQRPSDHV